MPEVAGLLWGWQTTNSATLALSIASNSVSLATNLIFPATSVPILGHGWMSNVVLAAYSVSAPASADQTASFAFGVLRGGLDVGSVSRWSIPGYTLGTASTAGQASGAFTTALSNLPPVPPYAVWDVSATVSSSASGTARVFTLTVFAGIYGPNP